MSDRSAGSFDPAAALRKLGEGGSVLDGLLRRTLEDWSRFRRRPSRDELARLERRLRACLAQVTSARTLLLDPPRRPGTETESGAFELPEAPAPRREHTPSTGDEEGEPVADPPPEDRPVGNSREGPASHRAPREANEPAFPSFRDRVTGLLSREGFEAAASGELKRSRRYGRPFGLLLLHLPDAGGAPARLREVAAVIHRELRESDLVARYGGRTLIVGLPETPAEPTRGVADRISAELRRNGGWEGAGSVAVAIHPADGETLPTLVGAARARLDSALGFGAGRLGAAGDARAGRASPGAS